MQLAMAIQVMEYIAEVVYHHYVASREGSGKEQEGIVVQEQREMREARIGTSEVLGENSKVQGEGPSSLSTTDKGKGKEKEVVGEETLQEE